MSYAASWLSRLFLGKEAIEEGKEAQRAFQRALNGHRFNPDLMREQLDDILHDVEAKAAALSSYPPPPVSEDKPDAEADEQHRSRNESTDRGEKTGTR